MRALLVLAATGALAACSLLGAHDDAASAGASRAAQQDAAYLHEISLANRAAIAAGRLALARSRSLAVKQFGRWMVDEHTALEAQAEELARAKGLAPSGADARRPALLDELRAIPAERFARAYLQQTLAEHTDLLQLLDEVASRASDARLRALAAQAAVHARQHLAEARRLAGDALGEAR